jgi:hypothetical protein
MKVDPRGASQGGALRAPLARRWRRALPCEARPGARQATPQDSRQIRTARSAPDSGPGRVFPSRDQLATAGHPPLAQLYQQARPEYADELYDELVCLANLRPAPGPG